MKGPTSHDPINPCVRDLGLLGQSLRTKRWIVDTVDSVERIGKTRKIVYIFPLLLSMTDRTNNSPIDHATGEDPWTEEGRVDDHDTVGFIPTDDDNVSLSDCACMTNRRYTFPFPRVLGSTTSFTRLFWLILCYPHSHIHWIYIVRTQ